MSAPRIPVQVIKGALQGQIVRLVRELLPTGRRAGNVWDAKNPDRDDRHGGSFKVWLTGPATGAWKDYACDDKGDVIDLISHCRGLDRGGALLWAQDWLGLASVDPAALETMKRESRERARIVDQAEQRKLEARRQLAFSIWVGASPKLIGSLVETYLGARGIDLAAIPNLEEGEIRFGRVEYWKGAERDATGRKLRSGPMLPAMVCAIRSPLGEVTGVHCTFLAPDGRGKADVSHPKLMLGQVSGAVIRLTRGASNLTPEAARQAGRQDMLAIGEGIEDGLSIGVAAPEARVWAATSLSNIGNVRVDDPCVSRVVVAADNDWDKPAAMAAFEAGIGKLEARGKPVAVMRSHVGKDINDLLRGAG